MNDARSEAPQVSEAGSSRSHRSRHRRKTKPPGNLVVSHQSLVHAEVNRLKGLVSRLEQLNLQPPQTPQVGEVIVVVSTDLNTDSLLTGALLSVKSIYQATRLPVIAIFAQSAPALPVLNHYIVSYGTPNIVGSHPERRNACAAEILDLIAVRHAACPVTRSVLVRACLNVLGVMLAFRKSLSRAARVCPCQWSLLLPKWEEAEWSGKTAWSRVLTTSHLNAIFDLSKPMWSCQNSCRPFHHQRCECNQETEAQMCGLFGTCQRTVSPPQLEDGPPPYQDHYPASTSGESLTPEALDSDYEPQDTD